MSRIEKLLIMAALFFTASFSYSQQWVSTYSKNTINDLISEDKAFSIEVSNSGFVYVTGFCASDTTGPDICTIKYNENGDTLWTRFFNGNANSEDKAYAIVVDDLDNVYITGYVTDSANGIDIITIKYSADGTLLWSQAYNGTANLEDKSQAICIDQEGNVYVTGYATNTGQEKDIIVIKYDSLGNLLWTYTYNFYQANKDDIANAMVIDNQGRIVVTGSSMRGTYTGSEDMITIKLYPGTGNRVWFKLYNGSGNSEDKAYAITVDDLDNVIITGYATSAEGSKDITTIKYTSTGFLYWYNVYDCYGFDDYAKSIAVTPDQGIIVTGTAKSGNDDGTEDFVTIKYSYYGYIEWVKTYNNVSSDIAYSLVVSEFDNSVYVTGSSMNDTTEGSEDMFTIELDLTTGNLLDTARYDGESSGEDVAYDIDIDTAGNVFLTGYTEPINGFDNMTVPSDFITVKYTGGNLLNRRNSIKVPCSFALFQNYPNPFNPNTVINFTLPQQGLAKLTVYDITGREVEVLVNQTMSRGDYSVNFNAAGLATGVYFYELKFGSYRDVKKMILLK